MKFKMILVIIALLIIQTIDASALSTPSIWFWWETSTEKVKPNTAANTRSFPMQLKAGRNEYEAAQLVLLSSIDQAVSLESSDMTGPGGVIPQANIALFQVEYVNIKISSKTDSATLGEWPDPLPTLKNPMTLQAKRNVPVWFEIKVPKDIPPGKYTGTIHVTGTNLDQNIPVELTVWDFTLPDAPHLRTAFEIWKVHVGNYYANTTPLTKDQDRTLLKKLYSLQAEHWLSAYNLIPYSKDDATMKKTVADFRDRGLLNKTYVYAIDEPCTEAKYDEVRAIGDRLQTIDPDVKLLLPTISWRAKNMIQRAEKLTGRTGYMAAGPNLWVLDIHKFEPVLSKARQDLGEEVWWYTAGDCPSPCPTYWIDERALAPRIIAWLQWKYRITGFLYWNSTTWLQYSGTEYINGEGPWANPKRGQKTMANQGSLLYPGKDGSLEPVVSMRMKLIREGMEDWEYLYLLKAAIDTVRKQIDYQTYDSSKRGDEIVEQIARTLTDYTHSSGDLYLSREKLAQEIVQTTQDPLVLIESVPSDNSTVVDSAGTISGKTVPGAQVYINGLLTFVDKSGNFLKKVSLKIGENIFTIKVVNGTAQKTFTRTFNRDKKNIK